MKDKKIKKIISLAIIVAFAAVILTSLIPFVGTIFLGHTKDTNETRINE